MESNPSQHATQTVLQVIPLPADLDGTGRVATGWILAKLDQAGSVLPGGHLRKPALLKNIGPIVISNRPSVGDCLRFRAKVVEAHSQTVDVDIEVHVQRRGEQAEMSVLSTRLQYVAVEDDGPDNVLSLFRLEPR